MLTVDNYVDNVNNFAVFQGFYGIFVVNLSFLFLKQNFTIGYKIFMSTPFLYRFGNILITIL